MSTPNKAEKAHHAKVRAIGCVVCLNRGLNDTPPEIHHIRDSIDRLTDHMRVIPLCAIHHRTGLAHALSARNDRRGWDRWREVGYHQAPAEFERRYGAQRDLLAQVNCLLNV